MSLKELFDGFEPLANAPNGLIRLRELILLLAIEGKLTPHDSNGESACGLVARIKNVKARLTKDRQVKAHILVPISDGEKFCRTPSGWTWARLEDIGQIVGGGTPRSDNSDYFSDNDIAWLTPADLYALKEKYIGKGRRDINKLGLVKSSAQLMPAGTVLFSSRAPIGYVAIASNELATNQGFKSCVPYEPEMSEFIYYFLRAVAKKLEAAASGTTFKEIPAKQFSQVVIPIPPLKEQKRIVTRIDELMRLCDELEAQQQAKHQTRVRLNTAVLAPLNKAASLTPEEFEQATRPLADNFDTLYDSIDTVSKLRATILQLAVQGKLAAQDRGDEPAASLVKRIGQQRQKLLTPSDLKKVEPQRSSDGMVIPFRVPEGWKWTRLGEVSVKLGAGSTPLGGKNVYQDEGVKFLRSQNVWNDGLELNNVAYISETIHKEMSGTHVQDGDILLNITGASIGRSCIVPEHLGHANVSQHVSIIRLVDKRLRFFIHLCIISPYVQDSIMQSQVGISREGLSMRNLKEFLLPIPPLAEQERIVAKVNQLMSLCDELEAKLRQAEADSEKLMNAAVKHVLDSVRNASKTTEEVFA